MARKLHVRDREEISKIRETIKEKQKEIEESLPPIVRDTGGAISNLKIDTPEYKKWVVDLQKNKNPLIGKSYMQPAPEYGTEDKIVDQKVEDMSDDFNKTLNEGTGTFDPNRESGPVADDLADSPKKDNLAEKKFMDINIIGNVTKKMSSSPNKKIKKAAIEQMRSYHNDPDYNTLVPIDMIIEKYKDKFLLEGKQEKKLIKHVEKKKKKKKKKRRK